MLQKILLGHVDNGLVCSLYTNMPQMDQLKPIEKMLAPRMVIPSCAITSNWKTRIIVAKTLVTAGPSFINVFLKIS